MNRDHKELASRRVYAGRRTYYLNLCQNADGTHFVVISEERVVGKDLRRDSVRIYQEHLDAFCQGLEQIRRVMIENGASTSADGATPGAAL